MMHKMEVTVEVGFRHCSGREDTAREHLTTYMSKLLVDLVLSYGACDTSLSLTLHAEMAHIDSAWRDIIEQTHFRDPQTGIAYLMGTAALPCRYFLNRELTLRHIAPLMREETVFFDVDEDVDISYHLLSFSEPGVQLRVETFGLQLLEIVADEHVFLSSSVLQAGEIESLLCEDLVHDAGLFRITFDRPARYWSRMPPPCVLRLHWQEGRSHSCKVSVTNVSLA